MKKILITSSILLCAVIVVLFVFLINQSRNEITLDSTPTDTPTPATAHTAKIPESTSPIVTPTIINGNPVYFFHPDSFTTGVFSSSLPVAKYNEYYDGAFISGSGDGSYTLNFSRAKNAGFHGDIHISDYDFSDAFFRISGSETVTSPITITFTNCKFNRFYAAKPSTEVTLYFENCTFISFVGSNATLERCQFRGDCFDGLNPFQNINVKNCYFLDKSNPETEKNKGKHTDGTQIYGAEGVDVENINFNNCRFEIPQLSYGTSVTKINACISVCLTYSNGRNLSFSDCILNGGGYSVYCCSTNGWDVSNVSFKNISVGNHHFYGYVYPNSRTDVDYSQITSTATLYVSSVLVTDNDIKVIVSNDTDNYRTLLIKTDKGNYLHGLDACPGYKEVTPDMTFSSFPFDEIVSLPKDVKWITCYDLFGDSETELCHVRISD